MPIYRYACGKAREERCKLANLPREFFDGEDIGIAVDLEFRLTEYDEDGKIDVFTTPVVWYETHGMFEEVDIKCPVCKEKATKLIGNVIHYFPGNCYLNKEECRRQMNIHKLTHDDPYGYMRPEGDKEQLLKKLKRGNKAPPKSFYLGGSGGLKESAPHRPD